jgi:hypothetical protein
MNLTRQIAGKFRIKACRYCLIGEHRGITFADMYAEPLRDPAFPQWTITAIDCICEHDSRRFARVQRYIDYIMNAPRLYASEYCAGNVCLVNFKQWKRPSGSDRALYNYAACFVHLATYGFLRERGIVPTRKNRERIEAFCRREENRFLNRIAADTGESLCLPSNSSSWRYPSGSRVSRGLYMLRGLRKQ